ncbi:MAG TPA: hypothetical protein EYP53_10580 [Candidatus Latescibacteria bacterium]|nr:hypothetical protein [Candidatus Latescibacterota bacterium]
MKIEHGSTGPLTFLSLNGWANRHKSLSEPIKTKEVGKKVTEDFKLKKACQDFEALFIFYLLKVMRKSIPQNGYLDGGIGRGIFQGIMDEKVAEKVSRTGQIGIWKVLYDHLSIREKDR